MLDSLPPARLIRALGSLILHMTGKRFELNWPYIAFVVVIAAGGLGFIAWMVTKQVLEPSRPPVPGAFNWPAAIIVDLGCVLCFAALLWKLYCDYHTEFTDDAVTRPSLFRSRRIRWAEVTEVKVFNGVGYHIHSRDERIVVSPYAYKTPGLVVDEVMRLWGAAQNPRPEPNNSFNRSAD
jgi:hypothetical protein